MKHQLNNEWSFYYMVPDINKSYVDRIRKVATFNTIEDFWALYSRMKRPSEIDEGAQIHLFKNKMMAVWENEENSRGGKLVFGLNPKDKDSLWENALMALIAGNLNEGIAGVVISKKSNYLLSFWITNSENSLSIKENIISTLKIDPSTSSSFKDHNPTNSRYNPRNWI